MALFGQDTPDPRVAAGGAALGDLLFGGPGARAGDAYLEQSKKNYQAADAMWQARDKRARAIAREGLPSAVTTAGYAPELQPLVSSVLGASASPNIRNLGDFADPADRAIDQQRQQALADGDIPAYNRLTALRKDKAYQPARVVGGNVLPDGVGLGDEAFQMEPLPQTQARIDDGHARTDAAVAKSNRAPAPRASGRRELSEVEADARMAYLQQKATEMAKSGKHTPEYVDAWLRNEAAKAGINMGEAVDTPLGDVAAATIAPPSVEAPRAFSEDEVLQAIRDARAAIKAGRITKDAAAARLRKHGLEHAAGRL